MKKWLIGLVVLLLLAAVCVYVFIPAKLVVLHNSFIGANYTSSYRCLTERSFVQKWWNASNKSKTAPSSEALLQKNNYGFSFEPRMDNTISVDILHKDVKYNSYITVLPMQADSSFVTWKTELQPGNNFFKKVQQYIQARQIKNNMIAIMKNFQQFMLKGENVYGLNIQQARVIDTILVSTKMTSATYPSTADYYRLLQQLKDHIAKQGAQETNYPMLNITAVDINNFETMVAIPVNKEIPNDGAILFKKMVPGNILVAEVTGGIHTINNAFRYMDHFISENHLMPPAMPFQSLVTNRLTESDTSKWITKLYYPVL